jgi:hypothetical protein
MTDPTDFKALGLDFASPFDICYKPRSEIKAPKPKKPAKTMQERVIASLEDPKPGHFNTDIPSREESDKTLAIRNSSDIWFLQRQAA